VADHDTLAGLDEATRRGREVAVEVVPGVELTAYEGRTEVHVVALFVDPSRKDAVARLGSFRTARRDRMERMIANLGRLGVEVTAEEVLAEAGSGAVGRPHLAAALVGRGHVADVQEAFDRFLSNDGPVYERKKEMLAGEAITLSRRLGGLPVLAHPATTRLDERLAEFKEAGLAGIEVWHYKHGRADVEHYLRLAARHGLVVSGGSDFHGLGRTPMPLGKPEVGYEVLEALREAHRATSTTEALSH
jgi:hypothetical protein